MLSISTLRRALLPEKIKTPERLTQVFQEQHNPIKLFGREFVPKFKLSQDVLDMATKGKDELSIPEKLFLKFTGKGNPKLNINIGKGATFNAPEASFGDVFTQAKQTVIQSVKNLCSMEGKTEVSIVRGNNESLKNAKQIIWAVEGNNMSMGKSDQLIYKVEGKNSHYGQSTQRIISEQYPPSIYEGILGGKS